MITKQWFEERLKQHSDSIKKEREEQEKLWKEDIPSLRFLKRLLKTSTQKQNFAKYMSKNLTNSGSHFNRLEIKNNKIYLHGRTYYDTYDGFIFDDYSVLGYDNVFKKELNKIFVKFMFDNFKDEYKQAFFANQQKKYKEKTKHQKEDYFMVK